ncbi:c-type cytochrome [Sphingorhabdus sp. SMR4y]|uniref:c-type cytochrome n=1 Tax=Sphingorhabdus sp. SMR4y TaxID=2584094 RepID=UPI000B5C8021|nr:c-type cytochrome [Sphingorhabdus sp. SMR4y]ASK89339.1 cytochrome c-552 [Sphingorhabdus sp. SMR4y]
MAHISKPFIAAAICMTLTACGGEPEQETGEVTEVASAAPAPQAVPGKMLFMQCAACHSLDAGGPHKTGPNLHNIVGRQAGAAEGYKYSKAMAAVDKIWTREELDQFLAKPSATVPGNIMAFAGIPDAEKRQQLIDYLETGSQ